MNDQNFTPACWFKNFSEYTWNWMKFVRNRNGLKVYETTITQRLILDTQRQAEKYGMNIQLQEATDERANGNDLELAVQVGRGYYIIPIQAKIVYGGGGHVYRTIKHKTQDDYQIDKLLRYANQVGGYPLYLFYNYIEPQTPPEEAVIGPAYGCSVCSARYISRKYRLHKHWKSTPSFKDLYPVMQPFHSLFEASLKDFLTDLHTYQTKFSLRRYSKRALVRDAAWVDFGNYQKEEWY